MITGYRQPLLIAALLLAFGVNSPAAEKPDASLVDGKSTSVTFIGLVENVLSGDQFQMRLTTGETILVNLAGIKAPAETSPYASVSQQWLSSQLKGTAGFCGVQSFCY